ncbi:CBS domain-containing protein CBSX3 [Citrus sinensis]|nr:CBS domain-containing protein CBSX3 [Citrus sinensis]
MQGAIQSFLSHGNIVKSAVLQRIRLVNPMLRPVVSSRFESVSSARMEEHGFESTTISDILKAKGKGADGSWLWCTTDDTVYDAVKSMTQHNVGALVVVKPGEQKSVAGIITERDYLRKIIVQGRSSKSTKVGDIMTEENKLITVSPDTKVLRAMQLMTDNRIRHIPVIDDKGMIGMVSIGDVVRAVVSEHREELNRLNAFIQGGETRGEVAGNVFVFFAAGLVRGFVAGVAVVVPLDVLPFRLLDCLRLVRIGWLGVCCGGIRLNASAAWPSAVMAAMTASSCLTCSGVGIALAAAAASSASTCSMSSSEAGGVAIFAVGMVGSSRSFSELSSASVGELSVSDLSPSSSGGSDGSASSNSTSAYGLAAVSSAGSSVAVASSLASAGAPVVLVSKLYCWSSESGKFHTLTSNSLNGTCRKGTIILDMVISGVKTNTKNYINHPYPNLVSLVPSVLYALALVANDKPFHKQFANTLLQNILKKLLDIIVAITAEGQAADAPTPAPPQPTPSKPVRNSPRGSNKRNGGTSGGTATIASTKPKRTRSVSTKPAAPAATLPTSPLKKKTNVASYLPTSFPKG